MGKAGLDFFPLDVSLDAKFELIEAEFGVTGFGVVVHLLQEIYGKAGYYIEWTEEVALLFARKVGLGGGVVSEIIEASIRRGMFDKEKYDKYRVLTSRGIQKRYFEAVTRRKVLEVDYNILLVDVALLCPNVDIQARNVNILSENACISKQSKGKESRVKESKGKESNTRAPRATPPTLDEVRSYAQERGRPELAQQFFDYFEAGHWIDAKGQPVRAWKQKFLTWEKYEAAPSAPRQAGRGKEQPDYQPTAERIRRSNDWIDDFLAKEGAGHGVADAHHPGAV